MGKKKIKAKSAAIEEHSACDEPEMEEIRSSEVDVSSLGGDSVNTFDKLSQKTRGDDSNTGM